MKVKEKVDYIINKLEEIYPVLNIPLDHKDPYTLLIAVLLSAQCTDKKVNEITPILFGKADTPEKMICLTIDEIRAIIKPCGLSPSKSKAIYNLSNKIKYPFLILTILFFSAQNIKIYPKKINFLRVTPFFH